MSKVGKYKDAEFKKSLPLILSALEWAEKQDVERLRRFLFESANVPLYCFSSGGSSASNDYLALLYETNMGMAKSLTPLAMASISDEALKSAKIIITSGSGSGVDEDYTVHRAAAVNPQGVCGITSTNNGNNIILNTLKDVTTNWFLFNTPRQSGFIGTDSIVAMFGLFYKTFTNDSKIVEKLNIDLAPSSCYAYAPRVEGNIPPLNGIRNFIVLYNGWSRPIAQDFESKMVESGIASVQLCDYRNYCHGRFIFLSRHFEDSALVLFITPRDKEYAKRLILEGKTYKGNRDVFPLDTPIIAIETKLDSPLASIDLLIKEQVFFNDVANAFGVEPCNPNNPKGINKEYPRSCEWGDMAKMRPLNDGVFSGSVGTLKGISRKKEIDYDPSKSIQEIAKANDVAIATVRKHIQEKNIDRKRDEKVNVYNKVWSEYLMDSSISLAALAKKLKMSVNTVKHYLGIKYEDIKLEEGKVGMATEHPTVKEQRGKVLELIERFNKFCKVRDKYGALTAREYLKRLHWTENKSNFQMINGFMQMKEFKIKFKNKVIEYIHNGKQIHIETQEEPQGAIPVPLMPSKAKVKAIAAIDERVAQGLRKSVVTSDVKIHGIVGAVIGDIVGSRFEFLRGKNQPIPKYKKLFATTSTFTDDTALTMAIADALLHKREFRDTIWEYGHRYPNAGFGASFKNWLKGDKSVSNNSIGNGCGMRVSPIGFHAKTLDEALELAKDSAIISHNSEEGIRGAQSIAAATFLAKQQTPKEEIKAYIEKQFNYNLDQTDEEIEAKVVKMTKKGEREFAENTCPLAIIAFLVTDDYESSIRKSISYSCDTDTVACMCGGISAAYYGVPQEIVNEAADFLPQELLDIINEFDGLQLSNHRITPSTYNRWGDILVYGSSDDQKGEVGARNISRYFEGKPKVKDGLSGRAYAIPTVGKSLKEIKEAVNRFCDFAKENQDKTFLITKIGCAEKVGYAPIDIAPMFRSIADLPNVYLPKVFREQFELTT